MNPVNINTKNTAKGFPIRELTIDEMTKYVQAGGGGCPFEDCDGKDIRSAACDDIQGTASWLTYRCQKCDRIFTDVLELVRVEADTESMLMDVEDLEKT
jgi:hypothetical protein